MPSLAISTAKTCFMKKGFTLIEILIVLGLLIFITSLGLFISLDTITRSSVYEERDFLVSLLWDTRAQALANVHEKPHGIFITDTEYILFEGAAYDASAAGNVHLSHHSGTTLGGDTTIIFAQLTGSLAGDRTITLAQDTITAHIDINAMGRIEW